MNIIPKIKELELSTGYLELKKAVAVYSEFEPFALTAFLARMNLEVESSGTTLSLFRNEIFAREEYQLRITSAGGIKIIAADEAGVINALTTLCLMGGNSGKVPAVEIHDQPEYSHRGLHIDCARHFFAVDEIKKIIEEISLVKINKFHLHLTDDQGWRIQIDRYPDLYTQCGENYYTKAEIKEIVAFAKERNVEVIPEIDMPGHTRAMTSAYPFLSCTGEKVQLAKCGGIYPVILCAGKDRTLDFVRDVLDEVLPLFESDVFHIGGDEAPKQRWKQCPDCQLKIKELGLKNETELQGYFTKSIKEYLAKQYGKKVICWNDSLDDMSHLDGDELIQYWSVDHKTNLPAFTKKGGRFIYSDMFDLYYDYVDAMSPMKRSFDFKPVIMDIDYADNPAMLGFEACTWSEYITDNDTLEKRIFPRIYALAEHAWSGGDTDENAYPDFKARLQNLRSLRTSTAWGSGDPNGNEKQAEKMEYIIKLSSGMDEETRAMTVESASVSEEFTRLFSEKMIGTPFRT